MVSLYFDPNGEKLFDSSKLTSNNKPPFQTQPIPGDPISINIGQENVASLKARIQELESELSLKKLAAVIFSVSDQIHKRHNFSLKNNHLHLQFCIERQLNQNLVTSLMVVLPEPSATSL